jgi:hypothetical protein
LCSDNTSTTVESCNGLDDDCDGTIDDGFNRDDNPVCSTPIFLGSVSGDTSPVQTVTDSWYNEEWDRVTITEDDSSIFGEYLAATVTLTSPPGVDYDLYVYCDACGGGLAGSSINGGLSGHTDSVTVRRNDTLGSDDTFDIIIEVRHFSSNICAYWDIQVDGYALASTATCN